MANFQEAQTRANVSRVLANARTYESALKEYKRVHHQYPAWSETAPPLTTPVKFLDSGSMLEDSFSQEPAGTPGKWLRYVTRDDRFIIWSAGPDGVSQITEADLNSTPEQLILKTYDATNGTKSPGDIIRSSILGRQ